MTLELYSEVALTQNIADRNLKVGDVATDLVEGATTRRSKSISAWLCEALKASQFGIK